MDNSGDTTLNLRFTFGAIMKLHETYGLNIMSPGDDDLVLNPTNLSRLVWAGLLHENSEITYEDALKRLETLPVREVINLTGAALQEALNSEDDEETEEDSSAESSDPQTS